MRTIHSSVFKNSISLENNAHIHFIGICGTAMASLAGLLKNLGYKITGSDTSFYPPMSNLLEDLKIPLYQDYKAKNLNLGTKDQPDLVIVGNVIRREYEEAQALLESNLYYISLPEAIGQFLIEDKQSIVVAGTHGKTTTTSLLSWIAETCELTPGFLIGGIAENFKKSFQLPKSNLFIIEGDEYDSVFYDKVPKFVHYRPFVSVITSIEFDHADIYKDLDDVKNAFSRLLELTNRDGYLVLHANDKNIADVLQHSKKNSSQNIITYGFSQEKNTANYIAKEIVIHEDYTSFTIFKFNQSLSTYNKLIEVKSTLFGEHNILNTLASIAVADTLSWPLDKVQTAIRTFQGIKRRQEIIGTPNNITVIEDFAHHPTAVKMTIDSIVKRFSYKHNKDKPRLSSATIHQKKDRKIFAVFEPRSATSRRNVFQEEYLDAFSQHQEVTVLIAKPFNQDGIDESNRFSSNRLINELKQKQMNAFLMKTNTEIIDFLKTNVHPHDIILIMSNGSFNGLYKDLLNTLESQ